LVPAATSLTPSSEKGGLLIGVGRDLELAVVGSEDEPEPSLVVQVVRQIREGLGLLRFVMFGVARRLRVLDADVVLVVAGRDVIAEGTGAAEERGARLEGVVAAHQQGDAAAGLLGAFLGLDVDDACCAQTVLGWQRPSDEVDLIDVAAVDRDAEAGDVLGHLHPVDPVLHVAVIVADVERPRRLGILVDPGQAQEDVVDRRRVAPPERIDEALIDRVDGRAHLGNEIDARVLELPGCDGDGGQRRRGRSTASGRLRHRVGLRDRAGRRRIRQCRCSGALDSGSLGEFGRVDRHCGQRKEQGGGGCHARIVKTNHVERPLIAASTLAGGARVLAVESFFANSEQRRAAAAWRKARDVYIRDLEQASEVKAQVGGQRRRRHFGLRRAAQMRVGQAKRTVVRPRRRLLLRAARLCVVAVLVLKLALLRQHNQHRQQQCPIQLANLHCLVAQEAFIGSC
jgi:hypothetical protein